MEKLIDDQLIKSLIDALTKLTNVDFGLIRIENNTLFFEEKSYLDAFEAEINELANETRKPDQATSLATKGALGSTTSRATKGFVK